MAKRDMEPRKQMNMFAEDEVDINSLLHSIEDLVTVSGIEEPVAPKEPIQKLEYDEKNLEQQGFGEAQIIEIKKGIARNLPVEIYAKDCYDWMQMYEIRRGLMDNLDTDLYENPLYSAQQMREIRLGLIYQVNVASYANLMLSAMDMNRIRKVLLEEAYKKHPRGFGRRTRDEDTGIEIIISDDCLAAYMVIREDTEGNFTSSGLMQILKEHEVTYGYHKGNLEKLARGELRGEEVPVAQGKLPAAGRAGWYELFFKNAIDKSRIVMPDEEVDYSDVTTIESVEPGKVLARYHAAQKHVDGSTVTGIPIEGKRGEDLPHLTGVGIQREPEQDVYVATEKGNVTYNPSTFTLNVEKIYEFRGDITYFQSVEYDGTVYIRGSVGNNVIIRTTGSVMIDGFLESAYIYAGSNVVIKSGCNGNEKGIIDSGGSVYGKFFENVIIRAKGLVESNYYLNCDIETDDRLVARSRKARIMGGSITATAGIEAVTVGNYLGSKTVFTVGDVDRILGKIEDTGAQLSEVQDKIKQLHEGRQKLLMLIGEEAAQKNALYQKTCAAISTEERLEEGLQQEIDRLKVVKKRAQKGYIKVYGEVQEDVIFNIGGRMKKIDHRIQRGVMLTCELKK